VAALATARAYDPGVPTLSVVITAPEGHAPALSWLLPGARALGAEIVVASGAGDPLSGADSPPDSPGARTLVVPGASVFELRAAGVNAARGPIVAVTEDHVLPAYDWCAQTLAAHCRNPDIAMIGGPVTNGSTTRIADWANYLATFGALMPPLHEVPRAPAIANVSFKRTAIPGALRPGELEFVLMARFIETGRAGLDAGPVVAHEQSFGALGTVLAHFHNGRCTGGMGQPPTARNLVRRALGLAGEVRRGLYGKRLPRRARLSLPMVGVLCAAHAAGELTGNIAGPGRSARHLQ
jgi:hypothetical protein